MMDKDRPAHEWGPLESLDQAKAWVRRLYADGNLWHFEDRPEDCFEHLSAGQLRTLGNRRDELYDFQWGKYDCPIGYGLSLLAADGEADPSFDKGTD